MSDTNKIFWVILPVTVVLAAKTCEYLCIQHETGIKEVEERKRQKYYYSPSFNTRTIINRIFSIKDKLSCPLKPIKVHGPTNIFQMFYFIKDTSSINNYIKTIIRTNPIMIKKSFYSDEKIKHSLLTVIILKDIIPEDKKEQIKSLLSHTLKITNGDRLVANFYIYHKIPDLVKENIIIFSLSNLSDY